MKMVKRKHSKLLQQDQAYSDKDNDQAKWLNYNHIGLVSSPNLSSKQAYKDLGRRVMRSTGRKDRHSKICTAKGPKDRRVRLAATTAIQFYDVQDRLGYERPSEAIEWLMKEAKLAIDDLQAETEQKTEHQTENDKEDPFMGFLVPSSSCDLHYLLYNNTCSAKPRSQNQTFGYDNIHNHPVQSSLFSGSSSLNSEATFTNWSLPQTSEFRNGEFSDVAGSAQQWLQAVSGGTLQSSYYHHPPSMNTLNLDYGNIPCLGTSNLFSNGGFNTPQAQGEDEKQNSFPNKPSTGSFLLNFQD